MIVNGLDLGKLVELPQVQDYPKTVKGRVVQIDGDFLAYQCSYEKPDEPKELEDMKHNVRTIVDELKKMAAAEYFVLHLTPKESNKGNRHAIALLKEYQANRRDRGIVPRFLHFIREWMHQELGAILHLDKEADDGMSIAQYEAIKLGKRNLSIIATKDKDLNMVPGLHVDWLTGKIVDVDGFGSISLSEDRKKIVGFGTAFFWAQVLMGDAVDNISGLPMVPGPVLNKIDPTQATEKALEKLKEDPTNAKALKTLNDRTGKTVGPVMVMKIMEDIKDDATAFAVCKALYKAYAEWAPNFTNWRMYDNMQINDPASVVTWQDAIVSEMKLLWMRRKNSENDVLDWLNGQ